MSSSPVTLRLATEPVVHATLEEIAREGARRALQKAIEDEVAEYVNGAASERDEAGHRLVVRNGHKPPRTILSGLGPIEVKQPRVDDRRVDENGVRFHFTSKIGRTRPRPTGSRRRAHSPPSAGRTRRSGSACGGRT